MTSSRSIEPPSSPKSRFRRVSRSARSSASVRSCAIASIFVRISSTARTSSVLSAQAYPGVRRLATRRPIATASTAAAMTITAVVTTPNPSSCRPWIRSDQGPVLAPPQLSNGWRTVLRHGDAGHGLQSTVRAHVSPAASSRGHLRPRPCPTRRRLARSSACSARSSSPAGVVAGCELGDAGRDREAVEMRRRVALERRLQRGEELLRSRRPCDPAWITAMSSSRDPCADLPARRAASRRRDSTSSSTRSAAVSAVRRPRSARMPVDARRRAASAAARGAARGRSRAQAAPRRRPGATASAGSVRARHPSAVARASSGSVRVRPTAASARASSASLVSFGRHSTSPDANVSCRAVPKDVSRRGCRAGVRTSLRARDPPRCPGGRLPNCVSPRRQTTSRRPRRAHEQRRERHAATSVAGLSTSARLVTR